MTIIARLNWSHIFTNPIPCIAMNVNSPLYSYETSVLNPRNWRWMCFWFTWTSISKKSLKSPATLIPYFGYCPGQMDIIPCNATLLWGECTLQPCGWTTVPINITFLKKSSLASGATLVSKLEVNALLSQVDANMRPVSEFPSTQLYNQY